MSDPIRDAAIEAMAKHEFERDTGDDWDALTSDGKTAVRHEVTPPVDAVLAVALPEWRKHAFELRKTAIREARAEAWDECASNAVGPYEDAWLAASNPYRADAEEQA